MDELLKQLGFKRMTGTLWTHEVFGIIQFQENTTTKEIAEAIYKRGYKQAQLDIRTALDITK